MTDTIFAISSGRPPAAIAVMRISGPAAGDIGAFLAGSLPEPRRATLRRLRDDAGETLDHALCLWFPGPDTATGEDVLELHLHGGSATIAAVEHVLAMRPGVRRAEPGEFTRRALTMGRIDLAQAEGLADLLAAETEEQRKIALGAAEGKLSVRIRSWLARLAEIGAQVEAMIDFDDEGDVRIVGIDEIHATIGVLSDELVSFLDRPRTERLRDGVRIVLAGAPNVGKSSLFNALLDREAAIVTPLAGTTRDVIEARIVRAGRLYTLVDTAGLRAAPADDPIERIGIDRARHEHRTADLVLALDASTSHDRALQIQSKADLEPTRRDGSLAVSVFDAASIDRLWAAIEAATCEEIPVDGITLDRRQYSAITAASVALRTDGLSDDLLILAEALRLASISLAHLIGVDATEAMLDALFARFCVGK